MILADVIGERTTIAASPNVKQRTPTRRVVRPSVQ